MNPLQKRNNPFSSTVTQKHAKIEPYVEENDDFEEETVIEVKKPIQKPSKKQIVEQELEKDRVKYTSTMDRKLRRAIKIICAERGLLFASFVEEACKEKLRREGAL